MEMKLDYTDVSFRNNGKLKLLIIVGTRPEIIRLAAVINKCRKYFDVILAHTGDYLGSHVRTVFLQLEDLFHFALLFVFENKIIGQTLCQARKNNR